MERNITRVRWNPAAFRTLLAAAGMVFLFGCNPAPRYSKPPVPLSPAFKEAIPGQYKETAGWKVAEPRDDRIRPKWWEMYNDPQLNALEEQVQISNQSVIAAEANFRTARAQVVSARSALFPTVSASASFTNSRFSTTAGGFSSAGTSTQVRSNSSPGNASSGGANGNSINEFSLPVDLTYTVDLWHRIRNTVAANVLSAQASAADVATALLSTQAELAQDYFQIRALDQQRAILQDTLVNYRENLNLTTLLFRSGLDSDEDVAQAQTQLDTAAAQATDLGVARATYEHAIATLIGKPPAEFSLPVGEFVPHPPPTPLAIPSELLERRPDIAAGERRVAAANAQIGVAKAAYYPTLSLTAAAGFQSSSFAKWFILPSRFWSLGPTLTETLFDAGARRGATEQAEASYDAAVANYRQTVLTDFQAVEDNLASLRILGEEVEQQETAIASSRRYLDLALTRYRTGIDSYLNVITAQNTLLANRESEVAIQLRQMTASVGLIMALGGGWDASQLPAAKNLTAKPGPWAPNGPPLPNTPQQVAAPNPPPLNAPKK